MNLRVLAAAMLSPRAQVVCSIRLWHCVRSHTVGPCSSTNRSGETAVYHYRRDDQECDRCLQPRPENGLSAAELVQLLQQSWPSGVDGTNPACEHLWQFAALDECGNDWLWSGVRESNRQPSDHRTDHPDTPVSAPKASRLSRHRERRSICRMQ